MPINIKGKMYVTVAERVIAIHEEEDNFDITTEVLKDSPVVIKATVKCKKGTFTGISAANPDKAIEKLSPYEVAESSAVGRALGFAGYGIVESIASADEMAKAYPQTASNPKEPVLGVCVKCGGKLVISPRTGSPYCENKCWLNKPTEKVVTANNEEESPFDDNFYESVK